MLLLLHGTGGNEDDMLPLGREFDPHATLLSPRGKVLENGAPRFFRRFAEGVFDEEDVVRRANELADFVTAAASHYGFHPGGRDGGRLLKWREHRRRDDAAAARRLQRRIDVARDGAAVANRRDTT